MRFNLVLFSLIFSLLTAESPWGKDASLLDWQPEMPQNEQCSSPLSFVGQKLIRFHQTVISPADGPRSHYLPSSSEYTRQAMVKYGFFRGVIYGCDRLMRENNDPWVYPKIEVRHEGYGTTTIMKLDPVP